MAATRNNVNVDMSTIGTQIALHGNLQEWLLCVYSAGSLDFHHVYSRKNKQQEQQYKNCIHTLVGNFVAFLVIFQ